MLPPKLDPHCPSVETFPVDDGAAEEIVVELATDVTVSVVVDEARIDDEEVWLANDDSDEVTTLKVVVIVEHNDRALVRHHRSLAQIGDDRLVVLELHDLMQYCSSTRSGIFALHLQLSCR